MLGVLTIAAACDPSGTPEPEGDLAANSALKALVSLVPTSDVESVGVVADGAGKSLFASVDDGTSAAAADDSTTNIRNKWTASIASYTAGYSGAPGGAGAVTVHFRAVASSAPGTVHIELYDGTKLVGKGAAHSLVSTYTSYEDTFSGLSVAIANNLRTKVVFNRASTSGYLRLTQLWIDVSAPGVAPSTDVGVPGPTPSAPPDRGGSPGLVTDANAVFAVPTVSKANYLVPIRPAPFNTRITRIGGDPGSAFTLLEGTRGTFGSDARHHYQKDQPWSSDGSLIALQNGQGGTPSTVYLDGETYAPKLGRCSNYAVGDDRWHPRPAHAHERINVKGSALSWFDVTTCSVTRSWTLPLVANNFGAGEGNPSQDGRFAALADGTRVIVVDMDPGAPNAPYPSKRIGPARDVSDCGLASGCAIDWVSVSPSGKYVVVSHNGDSPRVFSVNSSTLELTPHPMPTQYPNCSGDSRRGFTYDLGHADMALDPFDANEDVLIGQEHCGNVGKTVAGQSIGHVVKVRLRDGAITSLTRPTNEAYAHHVSARNYDRPGWVYVGYYPQPGKRFDDEIVAIKMDGSQMVERLAHKHSAFTGCYRCESHAVPSPDGRRVIFASNWAAACGAGCGSASSIQAYVADTRSSP